MAIGGPRRGGRRIAAALLITRTSGERIEVFLAERSPKLRFFGGYHALPGGVRGAEDGAGEDALLRCAVRELLEETGLCRFETRVEAADARRAREALIDRERTGTADGAPWIPTLDGVAPAALEALCRIETPPFAPVRYDTQFFHVPLHNGEEPEILPGELLGGRFWHPEEALSTWTRGELLLVPPVIILLEHLAAGSWQDFLTAVRATADSYEKGVLHQVRFSPGVSLAPLRTPTLPPATTTNCLIVGEEEVHVIDPGSPDPDEQERLFELLDGMLAEGRRVGTVLLTHHHQDHVGGVAAVSRRYGVPVRGHTLTLERLEGAFPRGTPIGDGDVLPLGTAPDGSPGWELRALFTPGHDRGHLCYIESRYGAAIVGDMISTVSTVIIDPPEGHLRTYLNSLERLGEEELATLYPAHGPAVRDGRRVVQQYLRHRSQRESALLRVLEEGPGRPEDFLPVVYWDVPQTLHCFALRSLVAGLRKLEEDGVAGEEHGIWRLV